MKSLRVFYGSENIWNIKTKIPEFFREEGRKVDIASSDFDDYRAKVNEYVEAHKSQPAINKLLHNEPISVDDYKELEKFFTFIAEKRPNAE